MNPFTSYLTFNSFCFKLATAAGLLLKLLFIAKSWADEIKINDKKLFKENNLNKVGLIK